MWYGYISLVITQRYTTGPLNVFSLDTLKTQRHIVASNVHLAAFMSHATCSLLSHRTSGNFHYIQDSQSVELTWTLLEVGNGNGHYHLAGYVSMWTHICSSVI